MFYFNRKPYHLKYFFQKWASQFFLAFLILTTHSIKPNLFFSIGQPFHQAQAKPKSKSEFSEFDEKLFPIFQRHCLRCHSSSIQMGGLNLSSRKFLFAGSDSGSVISPGQPENSRLFQVVRARQMPPDQKTVVSSSELSIIQNWIKGADLKGLSASHQKVNQQHIIPLMFLHCTACHGQRLQEGRLDLRTKVSMLKGGRSGPAIIPGDPENSLIIQKIHNKEMPPPGREVEASVRPMSSRELTLLKKWIAAGLPEITNELDTNEADLSLVNQDQRFWSFQAPDSELKPPLVELGNPTLTSNPIDAFISAKLEKKNLFPSPRADKQTLIRRASFDLTGLPPSPQDVKSFLADTNPKAYESLIKRLLSSPRYGERWGRYWLDLVGYQDHPYAYRYRDYVIRSFNKNKPYNRFLLEQIAGDELVDLKNLPSINQETIDNLIATGFLRMVPDETGNRLTNFVEHRLRVINDQIQIFSSSILGLTIGCARCHDHKFEPISQRDYYRLAAIFKGAFDEHDWMPAQFVNDPDRPMLHTEARILPYVNPLKNAFLLNKERLSREKHNEKINQNIARIEAALKEKGKPIREKIINLRLSALPKVLHEDLKTMLDTKPENRTDEQKLLAKNFEQGLIIRFRDLEDFDPNYKTLSYKTRKKVRLLQAKLIPESKIRALWDRGTPSPTYILRRGDPMSPGRWVNPGVPTVLIKNPKSFNVRRPWPDAKKTGRRLALAHWLTRSDHPLTSRVMVNRIWKYHFGHGIVKSLGNFGRSGIKPSHPELLDWLSIKFIQSGWDIKSLHYLMMTSNTYKQASKVSPDMERMDPENILFSRMPLRRMDAEELRDTLFLISGRLNEKPYGPPDIVLERKDGLATAIFSKKGWRRSIYVTQDANNNNGRKNPTILDNFDFPSMTPNCLERVESTVVPQALHLLNNSTVLELSGLIANQIIVESGNNPSNQVHQAYWKILNRPPIATENSIGVEALLKLQQTASQNTQEKNVKKALAKFCHTLLNSAGFLYID
ncbi:MAG: PSD1 and planctomycete cytochrome C domain-containing protein [Acidobacteriia bacterium]|nr:PSD1 and planctomycete cytochrome C domain-containing protein [Terriglobia bacterium]